MLKKLIEKFVKLFHVTVKKELEESNRLSFEKELCELLEKYGIITRKNFAIQKLEIKCEIENLPTIKAVGYYFKREE